MICNGRGERDGDHCCYMDGKLCEFLFIDRGGTPRCKVWKPKDRDTDEYRNSPVGLWFEEEWPGMGFSCNDWPQNMPNPETLGGLCCWAGKL